MSTLFVSDLHLDPVRPEITALFLRFLHEQAASAEALYILGDLFEAWIGDDDASAIADEVAQGLSGLAAAGVPVYFIHGNRDFLLGHGYARRCAMRLLPDPAVISLYGRAAVIGHGDLLCTDDTAYQSFRAQTRNAHWQQQFLAQPLAARQAFAAQARAASQSRQQDMKSDDRARFESITDVNAAAVEACLSRTGVDLLIHGHTHRPAIHDLVVDGRACQRVVLGDWYEQGSVLRVDRQGLQLLGLV
jgi:UDP-2,3-diacylglucosamine hydrolase